MTHRRRSIQCRQRQSSIQAAYGYAVAGAFDGLTKKSNKTFTYAGVKGQLNKHVNLGGFYARRNAHKSSGDL